MSFLKSKSCFYEANFCVLCFVMVCLFLLINIYKNRHSSCFLSYEEFKLKAVIHGQIDKKCKMDKIINRQKPVKHEDSNNNQTIDTAISDARVNKDYNTLSKENQMNKTDLAMHNNYKEPITISKGRGSQTYTADSDMIMDSDVSEEQISKSVSNANQVNTLDPGINAANYVNKEIEHISTSKGSQTSRGDPGINATHINGTLLEPVDANYTKNIYFTIKTTYKYYTDRLFPLMLTWLQTVDKNKVSIITDRSEAKQNYVDLIRKAGFNIIDTSCGPIYTFSALSCKVGYELGAYYNAVQENPQNMDNYQWYCHSDDDVYVNVPQLSQFLQQYDPHKPYYIGRWPGNRLGGIPFRRLKQRKVDTFKKMNLILKKLTYQFASGATFCISYPIMMEAKKFFNGVKAFKGISEAMHQPDDVTVGIVIGILLGYNLTETNRMLNQNDFHISELSLNRLTKYVTISSSIVTNTNVEKLSSLLKAQLPPDPTKEYQCKTAKRKKGKSPNLPNAKKLGLRFMLYHCLLYPTVSWCKGVSEAVEVYDPNNSIQT